MKIKIITGRMEFTTGFAEVGGLVEVEPAGGNQCWIGFSIDDKDPNMLSYRLMYISDAANFFDPKDLFAAMLCS